MASPKANLAPPSRFTINQLNKIHQEHPEIGKALQDIMEYLNRNVTPVQGTKVNTQT